MSFFITGTDTGIGKTMLTAALYDAMLRAGTSVVPMKPVQTGCLPDGGPGRDSDLEFCCRAAGRPVSELPPEAYPYVFEPACSPHLAASMADTEISVSRIADAYRNLAQQYDQVLVEGAGGVFVPLNARQTMIDLMTELGLPVLLAARPALGTLNHTLLSLEVLRARGLQVAGVVIVEAAPPARDFIERDNLEAIRHYGNTNVLGVLEYSVPQLPLSESVRKSADGMVDRLFGAVVSDVCG